MAKHTVTMRPATEEEARKIWPCPWWVAPVLLTAFAGPLVMTMMLLDPCGGALGLIAGAVAARLAWALVDAHLVSQVRLAAGRSELPEVAELEVRSQRALRFFADTRDPAVCIDIGQGKILLVWGQWVLSAARFFGSPEPVKTDDSLEHFFNSMPREFAFPSTHFRLSIDPGTHQLLGCEVLGEYLVPRNCDFDYVDGGPDWDVFQGSMDALEGALKATMGAREQRDNDVMRRLCAEVGSP